MKICIDPGHGGDQPGAAYGGRLEKDATLQIARKLARKLKENGHEVIMTRDDDALVSLRKRCDISNDFGADAFISVHLNASCSPEAHGAETWQWDNSESTLALNVQSELVASTGARDRGVKSTRSYYVLRHTHAVAIVVECGFISNDAERSELFEGAYQEKIASGIAKGILRACNDGKTGNRDRDL